MTNGRRQNRTLGSGTGSRNLRVDCSTARQDHGMTTTATGVDAVLEQARIGMRRLDPHQTRAAVAAGALLIDTRTDRQRAVHPRVTRLAQGGDRAISISNLARQISTPMV